MTAKPIEVSTAWKKERPMKWETMEVDTGFLWVSAWYRVARGKNPCHALVKNWRKAGGLQ